MSAPCPTFGFVLRATIGASPDGSLDEVGAFKSELIELLEANGLMTHGAGGGVIQHDGGSEGVVVIVNITREGAQATDADRKILADWTKRWDQIARTTVSDLVDLTQLAS